MIGALRIFEGCATPDCLDTSSFTIELWQVIAVFAVVAVLAGLMVLRRRK